MGRGDGKGSLELCPILVPGFSGKLGIAYLLKP